jgi:hypothetical protein
VYFVFEDDDASISCRVDDKTVAPVKPDALPISGEGGHQVRAAANRLRPTGKGVPGLENDIIGKGVEVVLAVN